MIDDLVEIRSKMAEDNIRKNVFAGNYFVSNHAQSRMAERMITHEKVVECITKGKCIETQLGKELGDIKVLFQESKEKNPEVYTVVADRDKPVIVTVCRSRDEVWECIDDVLRRRELNRT